METQTVYYFELEGTHEEIGKQLGKQVGQTSFFNAGARIFYQGRCGRCS